MIFDRLDNELQNQFFKCAKTLLSKDKFLIITHYRPDGDTLGSALALCSALQSFGKTAYILKNPDTQEKFIDYISFYEAPPEYIPNTVITVDIADISLLTDNAKPYSQHIDFVIDHHPENRVHSKNKLCLEQFAAAGEIVYLLINAMDCEIDEDIAAGIYIAISTDTGCFKYSNTSWVTHAIAAEVMEYGVDITFLNKILFETKSRGRFALEQQAISNLEFYADGRIAIMTITNEMKQSSAVKDDETEDLSAIPRTIEGVEVAVTITESKDGNTKVSVRTVEEFDAAELCKAFDGGGHARAAGCLIKKSVELSKPQIIEQALKFYDN